MKYDEGLNENTEPTALSIILEMRAIGFENWIYEEGFQRNNFGEYFRPHQINESSYESYTIEELYKLYLKSL